MYTKVTDEDADLTFERWVTEMSLASLLLEPLEIQCSIPIDWIVFLWMCFETNGCKGLYEIEFPSGRATLSFVPLRSFTMRGYHQVPFDLFFLRSHLHNVHQQHNRAWKFVYVLSIAFGLLFAWILYLGVQFVVSGRFF